MLPAQRDCKLVHLPIDRMGRAQQIREVKGSTLGSNFHRNIFDNSSYLTSIVPGGSFEGAETGVGAVGTAVVLGIATCGRGEEPTIRTLDLGLDLLVVELLELDNTAS